MSRVQIVRIGFSVLPRFRSLTGPVPAVIALVALSACSSPDTPGGINDPYEPVNRAIHQGNKGIDRILLRPVGEGYGHIVPEPVRISLSNAAANLDTPRSVVNNLLQGNLDDAGHNVIRFMINSTIGVFGLFDPAGSDFGLEPRETGFADTFAAWSVPEGAYLELPLFGPSTERDAVGLVLDIVANPIGVIGEDGDTIAALTSVPAALNSRYQFAQTVDSILYDSADSYAQLRLYYLESRRFELSGQTSAENAFDPYADLYEEVYEGLYDDF